MLPTAHASPVDQVLWYRLEFWQRGNKGETKGDSLAKSAERRIDSVVIVWSDVDELGRNLSLLNCWPSKGGATSDGSARFLLGVPVR